LEERSKFLEKMADDARHGRDSAAAAYAQRGAESRQHAGDSRLARRQELHMSVRDRWTLSTL